MNLRKIDFRLGFALVMFLPLIIGCNRNKSTDKDAQFKNVPVSQAGDKTQLDKNARSLAANQQANIVAQKMGQPPAPLPTVPPTADIQRSLKTVEEINRMNRLNQELRQNQPQKR